MDLTQQLQRLIGAKHVLTGPDAAPYGKDWMGAYVAQPRAVLRPANTAEVSAILKLAHQHTAPIDRIIAGDP